MFPLASTGESWQSFIKFYLQREGRTDFCLRIHGLKAAKVRRA
ncbi:hypothetical protein D082_29520 [Synechocystis sp. PCC 6714]|nr:hypothetical protein D082_29520 [Synechocystis sp. PCC 6714]